MLRSWWLRSVAQLFRSRPQKNPSSMVGTERLETRRRLAFRPQLAELEDRWCPATFTVNALTDTGAGSGNAGDLRFCIAKANSTVGADTIVFSSAMFATARTITLSGTQLTLTDTTGATTITGPARGVTINGNNASRVFLVNANVTASFSRLTITGGTESAGGGILNNGTLTLTNCTITGNTVTTPFGGGGVLNSGNLTLTNCTLSTNSTGNGVGGGVNNTGTATLTNCIISENSANGAGGAGVHNIGTATLTGCTISGNTTSGGGGGVFNNFSGTVTLTNCTISGNLASSGGGSVFNNNTATLTNCTISGNFSNSGGAGVNNNFGTVTLTNCTVSGNITSFGGGGGVFNNSTATLTNCTLSGNSAGNGGGGMFNNKTLTLTNCTISGNVANGGGGGMFNNNAVTLTNCTISGNSVGSGDNGGGVYDNGTASLRNTILAGNTAGTGPDGYGGFNSLGYNLIGKTDGSSGWGSSDFTGTIANALNPLLAPLGNYGGPTQTMAVLPGSVAIDAGTSNEAPATDQRGVSRVGNVDIGAFESRGFTIAVVSGSPQSVSITNVFTKPLVAKVTAKVASEPVTDGQVTFTPPSSGASATLNNPVTIAANGRASATATANGTLGTYTVVATANGISNSASFSLTNVPADAIRPTIRISPPSLTYARPGGVVTFTITYADANFATSTLTAADIRLNRTGTANGTVVVTGTGKTRTVTIRNLSGTGTLSISIVAGTASDTAGNLAPAAGPSQAFLVRPLALNSRPR